MQFHLLTNEHARRKALGVGLDLLVNVALPYALFSCAKGALGELDALLVSSIPPILWSIGEFARRRKLDAISLLAIAGIALSVAAFFGGGSVQLLQLREKLVTGILGTVFLGSAMIGKPIFYEFTRAGMSRRSAEGVSAFEEFETRYGSKAFRRNIGLITAVWGIGLLADVLLSCVLIFAISVQAYLLVNPALGYGTMGLLAAWTFYYARKKGLNGSFPAAATAPDYAN